MAHKVAWLAVASALLAVVRAGDAVDATVTAPMSKALPGDFASFSMEVASAKPIFTIAGDGVTRRTSWVNLMNVLKQASGGSRGPNIRIGGNSADESVWLPGTTPLPTNDTYRITQADLNAYGNVVPQWNGTITLDVNLRDATDPSLAVAHVNAALATFPASMVDGIEIGNEVDLFMENGIRPPSYDANDYLNDFELYQTAIKAKTSAVYPKIQGAVFCCGHFDSVLNSYIENYGKAGVLSSVSYHHYPLSNCNSPNGNTVYDLLDDSSANHESTRLAPFVQTALTTGIPFYIGEGNSVSCGGQYNISDVFGATLWSIDVLFNMASVGVTRWNFHGGTGGAYTWVTYSNTSQDLPVVKPLFYGIWAFDTATAYGGVVHNVTYTQRTNNFIKVWPTLDSTGTWRVTVLHKDANATVPATVTIRLPSGVDVAAGKTGSLSRLAPAAGGVFAKAGISFGGLTFDGSETGIPQGTPVTESVQPAADGSYTFSLNPASAAILSI